jgi:hypothetical protein
MSNWCNCAVGHASRDQYFIDEGLTISGLGESPMTAVAQFFGIESEQSYKLFLSSGYIGADVLGCLPPRLPAPADVIARLEVLLLEKRANEAAKEAGLSIINVQLATAIKRELEPVS